MSKLQEMTEFVKSAKARDLEVKIRLEDTGIAWAGFWIGLGLLLAAAVMKGTLVIK